MDPAKKQLLPGANPLSHRLRFVFMLVTVALCLSLLSGPPAKSASATSSSKGRIPDVEVTDQNGAPHHFYTDLVKGRVVAINFVYTTCTTICPPLGATFGKLQKSLGEHFGKDIFLVSISVDPVTDTPARLHAWAAQFGARPGWTLVTGPKSEISRLLKALGADTASPESHSPMVLVINDKTGTWKRVYGMGATAELTRSIEQIATASAAKDSN